MATTIGSIPKELNVSMGLFICEPKFLAGPELLSQGQNFGLKFRPGDRNSGLARNFGSQMNSPLDIKIVFAWPSRYITNMNQILCNSAIL